jgi:hypothetical protein
MISLPDFKKLRLVEHSRHIYPTEAGTYCIDYVEKSDTIVVYHSPAGANGVVRLLSETLTRMRVECCLRHAYLDAEAFCYGNMSALLSHTPNPRSPWAT